MGQFPAQMQGQMPFQMPGRGGQQQGVGQGGVLGAMLAMQYPQAMVGQAAYGAQADMFGAQQAAGASTYGARQAAEANRYGSELGFLGQMGQQPWNLAQVAQATVPQAQANIYGSYAGSLADMMQAMYPAASSMFGSATSANAARDIAQLGNESRSANLFQMLQSPMFQRQTPQGFQTSYGAGVS